MSRKALLAAGIAVVAAAGLLAYHHTVDKTTSQVSRLIQDALKRREMPADAPWRDRRTQSLLRAFYAGRRMRPAWTTGAGPTTQARELRDVLLQANREGLSPKEYSALELSRHLERNEGSPLAAGDPRALADFDLLCSIGALHYMSDVTDGRISPKALDAVWVANPRKGDLDATLDRAVKRQGVRNMLEELPPAHEGYRKLREARARYAKIVASGGWKPIPAGGPLKRGQRGPRVAALRARLVASGDLPGVVSRNNVFDEDLAAAVSRFQGRCGRDPDGVVGSVELAELNVPAEARLRQIELNMERWRWLPRSFGERHLIVNIPEYMLRVFEGQKQIFDMRVVVGKAMSATPVFSDTMTQVVLNPVWNVPQSIADAEIIPAVRDDRDYLAKHALRIYDGPGDSAGEVDPGAVHWWDDSETVRLNFRQDAGDSNSLGRIKFLFPNRFDIYLHDTPAGQLFSSVQRSFSHGCIRVEDPIRLAAYVLRGLPVADPDSLRARIETGQTKTIKIPKPLPVHIVYFTAFVDGAGAVGFREDVYGIDEDLIGELRGRALEQAAQAGGHTRGRGR